jgi:hypothetical protein
VVRDGRGVLLPAASEDARLAEAERLPGATRALSCAPIHARGKVIGVLQAFNPLNKAFDPDALLVLTGLIRVEKLTASRGYVIIALFVVSAIITPTTDAFTLFVVALPIWLLYEVSIVILKSK